MSLKNDREVCRMVEQEGAVVVAKTISGGSHLRVTLRAPSGQEKSFIFARTPSDSRAMKNGRALVRSWLREQEGQK